MMDVKEWSISMAHACQPCCAMLLLLYGMEPLTLKAAQMVPAAHCNTMNPASPTGKQML
jgi:hypothetical protein